MNGLGPEGPLLERFFERQRREIVDRILRERSTVRRRRTLTALAAAVLAAVAFGGIVLERGPGSDAGVVLDLWNLPAHHTLSGEDPLAAFGEWEFDNEVEPWGVLDAFAVPEPGSDATDAVLPRLDGDDRLLNGPLDSLRG
jgi:hypothetical protein